MSKAVDFSKDAEDSFAEIGLTQCKLQSPVFCDAELRISLQWQTFLIDTMVSVGGREKETTMRNKFLFSASTFRRLEWQIQLRSFSLCLPNDQRCIDDVSSQFVVFAEENSERDGERREFLSGVSPISWASVQRCSGYLNA